MAVATTPSSEVAKLTPWAGGAERRLTMASGWAEQIERACQAGRSMGPPDACTSLAEALEDSLTIHRPGITGALRKTLITTNPIESTYSITKRHYARVRRWRGFSMVLRWIEAGLVRAEAQYRRVAGHAQMPLLIAALENESLTASEKLA